ncbi:MAG: single-stranded DNA-binding protein [Chitinophagaceae bacterium]|nr:MAG: single-stranded DNA-binding protein [Chitinophagaceae bacterium]
MEITGRVTADAKTNVLQDDRQVVNFTIAINDYYRPKGNTEAKQLTTYVNCSYWVSSRVAERLIKGALVQLYGRIGVQAYNNMDGNAKASLTFHCNNIKVLATPKNSTQQEQQTQYVPGSYQQPQTTEDVPF